MRRRHLGLVADRALGDAEKLGGFPAIADRFELRSSPTAAR
jgi:hypothetical protein